MAHTNDPRRVSKESRIDHCLQRDERRDLRNRKCDPQPTRRELIEQGDEVLLIDQR